MQDPDLIALFVAPLEKAGISYMITGSIASSIYGEPRNNLDIEYLEPTLTTLGLTPQYQAAQELVNKS